MGYLTTKEERLNAAIEKKLNDVVRKTWLPRGRIAHLSMQVERMQRIIMEDRDAAQSR